MADRKPTYDELVEKLGVLESKLNEINTDYMLFPRKPLGAAPSALDEGNAAFSWDGSTAKLHLQIGGGLKTLTFS